LLVPLDLITRQAHQIINQTWIIKWTQGHVLWIQECNILGGSQHLLCNNSLLVAFIWHCIWKWNSWIWKLAWLLTFSSQTQIVGRFHGACKNTLGTKTSDKCVIIYINCINQTTSWLMHSWSIFSARMNHRDTQTHKTHHGLDLGEAITFPLIVFFVTHRRGYTQMVFFSRFSSRSFTILELGLPALWMPIIFYKWKPLIKVKSEAKL